MKTKYLWLGLAFVFAGCSHKDNEKGVESYHCSTIHKPRTGCPPNWSEFKDRFTEKDGSTESACLAPPELNLKPCIDELRPGEGMHFSVPIPETITQPVSKAHKKT